MVTREQLLDLKRKVAVEIGQKQAEIFNATCCSWTTHLRGRDQEQVRKQRTSAEWAIHEYVTATDACSTPWATGHARTPGRHPRRRPAPHPEPARRLLAPLLESSEKRILVAKDLTPPRRPS